MIAQTPGPPYTAVIFKSQRTEGDNGYGAMVRRMEALAAQQAGSLGIESAREDLGITAPTGPAPRPPGHGRTSPST